MTAWQKPRWPPDIHTADKRTMGPNRYVPAEDQVEIWLQEFDLDIDGTISEHEFVTGIAKWVKRVTQENLSQQTQNASSLAAKDPDFWAAKSNDAKAVL